MASESESEKRETSADVADEIRRAVESMGDEMPYTVSAGTMRRVADRIEAAEKRVVVSKTETTTVGNAAAMREALVGIRALIADEPDGTPMIDAMKATIEAALSAPARQCDVGTAEEQEHRYKATGEVYHTLTLKNALAWAQMPYASEEGGAK